MAMTLGEYTLIHYPADFTIPKSERSNAYEETMGGVEHFTWGFFLVGKIIEISWPKMPSVQFDALFEVFLLDTEVIWDPGIPGEDALYSVQILDFIGAFHETVGTDEAIWRTNCKMTLLIMSIESES